MATFKCSASGRVIGAQYVNERDVAYCPKCGQAVKIIRRMYEVPGRPFDHTFKREIPDHWVTWTNPLGEG